MKTRILHSHKPGHYGPAAPEGERALIAAIRSRVRTRQTFETTLRQGIGDDCAILRPPGKSEIVVTTDFSLEYIHFRRDWHTPESAGHRCLARGLSDLAAMGARPLAAFLSLAIPSQLNLPGEQKTWVQRFFDGLLALANRHKVPLAGGDTAQSPEFDCHGDTLSSVSADIVLLGSVKRGHALLRSGARPGDIIYVTGELGGAAAELMALERNPDRFARLTKASESHPHLYPEPRINIGLRLVAGTKTHSAIDLSDGLSTDLLISAKNRTSQLNWMLPQSPSTRLPIAQKRKGGFLPPWIWRLTAGKTMSFFSLLQNGRSSPGKSPV